MSEVETLYLRDEHGTYRVADPDTVLSTAKTMLGQRVRDEKRSFSAPRDVREFFALQLARRDVEIFAVLFLDMRLCFIAYEEMFTGTISGVAVYPREILRRALYHNAATVVVGHPHPSSGVPEPSRADEVLTQRLKEALGLVEIRLVDHIVVGDAETVSFAERGLI